MGLANLPKKYVPADHEPGILDRWEASGAFHADPARVSSGRRTPYCIIIPPPNVTDRLHLGHALNNSLQDILVRAHRMRGLEALWLPGTDHAGIATQTKVDRMLLEAGEPGIADYKKLELEGRGGRDQFVAKVQAWKDEFEATITGQLRRMGCSCDWERQRFTMDDICARAVREAFFRLFKDGLIYRGKRLVNWDPATQTALADDEVEMREVDGAFYYMRYPLSEGDRHVTWSELWSRGYPRHLTPKGEGAGDDDRAFVTVATTRPETYLGDTAVATHPKDPRAGAIDGLLAELPLVGRMIPVIQDDYVVMPDWVTGDDSGGDAKAELSTGFLKVTPAHDPNDEQIGKRHDLASINIMAPDASISDQHGWADVGEARLFLGLSREDARKKVVAEFRSRGLLEDTKPHRHSVGHSYRSHVPVEPYLSDQWYVKVTDPRLVGFAQRALADEQRTSPEHRPRQGTESDGALRFYPDRYAKTYETWHDNLRDWCISRQLWWGHRIAVWRWTGEREDISEEMLPQLAEVVERLLAWQREGRVAIQYRGEFVELTRAEKDDDTLRAGFFCVRDPDGADREIVEFLEAREYARDPDVLDTWFSSALWPLNTMGWPDPDQSDQTAGLLDAFNPTDVLCTAREIITLWVSRMVMFNRYFRSPDGGKTPGPVPYRDVFIHAMIQDGEGRKMSKSLGNGVDPLDIIHSHGSDAMRFTLCKMTTQTQDVRMPVEPDPETGRNTSPKFDEGRNFCTKLWNAARFTLMKLESGSEADAATTATFADVSLVDRWMLSRLAGAVEEIERSIRAYRFNEYAQTLYDLLWRDFCDWYLEAIKPTVEASPAQRAVLHQTLDAILRLLHPICPFITEEIWSALREAPHGRVGGLTLGDAEGAGMLCVAPWPEISRELHNPEAEQTFERLRTLVEAVRRCRADHEVKSKERLTLHAGADIVALVTEGGGVVETLAGLAGVTDHAAGDEALEAPFEGGTVRLSGFEQTVDAGAVRAQLEEQIAKLEKDVGVIEKRLGNPGYVEKAPEKLVNETREQLKSKSSELQALRDRLEAMA